MNINFKKLYKFPILTIILISILIVTQSNNAVLCAASSASSSDSSEECVAPPYDAQVYVPYSLPTSVGETVEQYGNTITKIHDTASLRYPKYLNEDSAGNIVSFAPRADTPIIDAEDFSRVGSVPFPTSAPSWVVPGRIWDLSGGNLQYYDQSFGSTTTVATNVGTRFDDYEGNFSIDDRYVVATDGTTHNLVDTTKGEISATKTADSIMDDAQVLGIGRGRVDWVDVSKRGKYILANIIGPRQVMLRYNIDFTNPILLGNPTGIWEAGHADFFLCPDGGDCMVLTFWDGLAFAELDNPTKVNYVKHPMSPAPGYGHVSGNAIKRPGWILHTVGPDNGGSMVVYFDPDNHTGAAVDYNVDYLSRSVPENSPTLSEFWGYHQSSISYGGSNWISGRANFNITGDHVYFENKGVFRVSGAEGKCIDNDACENMELEIN